MPVTPTLVVLAFGVRLMRDFYRQPAERFHTDSGVCSRAAFAARQPLTAPCGIRPNRLPTAQSHFKLLARPSMVQSGAELASSAAVWVLLEVLEGGDREALRQATPDTPPCDARVVYAFFA